MNPKFAKILTGAMITGLLSGGMALANDPAPAAGHDDKAAHADAPAADGHKDKAGCGGKGGCGGHKKGKKAKKEKKAPAAEEAKHDDGHSH